MGVGMLQYMNKDRVIQVFMLFKNDILNSLEILGHIQFFYQGNDQKL